MSTRLSARIRQLAEKYQPQLIDFRRDMHRHPETAFREFRATQRVTDVLLARGLDVRVLSGGTGLLCRITPLGGDAGQPAILLRADMDALPIGDETTSDFRSEVPGVTHGCGHDVHTTGLLGAGHVLADLRDEGLLQTPVTLLFQPAEEIIQGALHAIRDGALDRVAAVHAVHCDPTLPVGRIGLLNGPITSGVNTFDLRVVGRGGHGARPYLTSDVPHAAHVVETLLYGLPRRFGPDDGVTLSIPLVQHGEAYNGMPPRARIAGTARTRDPEAWRRITRLLGNVFDGVRLLTAEDVEWTIDHGLLPPMVNTLTDVARAAVVDLFGADAVATTAQSQGGEDLAWFVKGTEEVPGVPGQLARLGTRPMHVRPDEVAHLHEGSFDPDEGAIAVAAAYLAGVAVQPLGTV